MAMTSAPATEAPTQLVRIILILMELLSSRELATLRATITQPVDEDTRHVSVSASADYSTVVTVSCSFHPASLSSNVSCRSTLGSAWPAHPGAVDTTTRRAPAMNTQACYITWSRRA